MLSRRTLIRRSLIAAGLTVVVASCGDAPTDEASSIHQSTQSAKRYIVGVKNADGRAAVAAAGSIALDLDSVGAVAAVLPDAAVAALQSNPNIGLIEEDPKRYLSAETTPYGVSMVQADTVATNGGSLGAGKTVCIIDSGLATHTDLPTSEYLTSDAHIDSCGHGTHVAGTVAALTGNDTGVASVSPDVNLRIVRVFGDDCSWSYASDLIDAAELCNDGSGTDIISMSLGGTFKSRWEDRAFASLEQAGVLSIAAAGNDGNTRKSYPASYDSVVSVAAIDEHEEIAQFSQQNNQVELAAPGVAVLSTVPWHSENSLTVDSSVIEGTHIEGSGTNASASGQLVDGGLCDTTFSASGAVVLCERGSISFADKVNNVENSGGVAAVIYNNTSGGFAGTCADGCSGRTIGIGISQEAGQALMGNNLGAIGTVTSSSDPNGMGYEKWDGTSMATPHVSGVAALVWSNSPASTNQEIRDALAATAKDLGAGGRDDAFGHGLVQAQAAIDYLTGTSICNPDETSETSCSDGLDNDCDTFVDADDADCTSGCTVTEDPEVSCDDGVDNDCDGTVDTDDPDCDSGPSCELAQVGEKCDADADCCSGKCRGKPNGKTCK